MIKEQGIRTSQPHKEMDVDNDLTLHQEVDEFLKLIKRSDYKVVDQIYQTPSKIFVISLLLNSEAHKGALMKVLM